jgi:hypothetical protein
MLAGHEKLNLVYMRKRIRLEGKREGTVWNEQPPRREEGKR